MTIYDFNEIGKYIAKKTNKETIFQTSKAKIENEDFKHIWLVGNVCCIRHKNDNSKKTIQYKTFNGIKNYIDKWLGDIK